MKKLFLGILLLFFLSSCHNEEYYEFNQNGIVSGSSKPYSRGNLCEYLVVSKGNEGIDRISIFVDTCGKFNPGDTIRISKK